jgi:hypothetical protein
VWGPSNQLSKLRNSNLLKIVSVAPSLPSVIHKITELELTPNAVSIAQILDNFSALNGLARSSAACATPSFLPFSLSQFRKSYKTQMRCLGKVSVNKGRE